MGQPCSENLALLRNVFKISVEGHKLKVDWDTFSLWQSAA